MNLGDGKHKFEMYCDEVYDIEIINYLNALPPRRRSEEMRAAMRVRMNGPYKDGSNHGYPQFPMVAPGPASLSGQGLPSGSGSNHREEVDQTDWSSDMDTFGFPEVE